MEFPERITPDQITMRLMATDRAAAIREMLDELVELRKVPEDRVEEIIRALFRREVLGTTAIGGGVAVPHAHLDDLDEVVVAIGLSETGVDFQADDDEPVKIVFLVLGARDRPHQYLDIIQRIGTLMENEGFLEAIVREIEGQYSIEHHEAVKLPAWEKAVLTWVVLMAFWIIVSGSHHWQNLLVGGGLVGVVAAYTYNNLTEDLRFRGNVVTRILRLTLVLLPQYLFIMAFQLIESNFRVARHALVMDIKPAIVRIKTNLRSSTATTLLANSITLTPGTLTVDVVTQEDGIYLYVHWIDVQTLDMDQARDHISRDVEQWLKQIFW